MINERLPELGIALPSVAPPVDNYVGCVIVGPTAELPFDIAVENQMTSPVQD